MFKEIRVLLLDDDPFSRGWMEFLLRRDLRIRVIYDTGDVTRLEEVTSPQTDTNINLVLVDTDVTYELGWLKRMLQELQKIKPSPRVMFCGLRPYRQQMDAIVKEPGFSSYVLKNEIGDSLGWAVALCADGYCVLTQGVIKDLPKTVFLPKQILTIASADRKKQGLTENQSRTARMAFVLSMERRDMADELGITTGTCMGNISTIYNSLGLSEFLQAIDSGQLPKHYHDRHPAIQKNLKFIIEIIREAKKTEMAKQAKSTSQKVKDKEGPKAPNKETIAFHLLTIPEIER